MTESLGEQISVCLLTYNHVAIVESTIQSILEQTISGYDVIVSDDCSTDGTWDVILALAAKEPRIRPVRTPRNMGMPGNANFAVSHSSRPYLALLHHDDIYRADLLEKWHAVMARYPDVGFVFNAYGVYQSSYVYGHPFDAQWLDGKWFLENHLFPSWGCPVRGTAMIRRSWFEKVGGFREEFGLLADIDLWMRLAAQTAVGYVSEPLITVRQVRPAYYPEAYQNKTWSWMRQRYLYEIHAANRLAYFDSGDFIERQKLLAFRFRMSLATAKWLTYALVRRRWRMIETCGDSVTAHDQLWLRAFRGLVRRAARPLINTSTGL